MKNNYKNRFYVLLSCLTLMTVSASLEALSFGRDGASYEQEGVTWQPVKIETDKGSCKTVLPGSPRSAMSEGWIRVISQDSTGLYILRTTLDVNANDPQTAKEFLEMFEASFANDSTLSDYQSSILEELPKGVKYALEYSFVYQGDKQLTRIYCNPQGRLFALMVIVTPQTRYEVFDHLHFE